MGPLSPSPWNFLVQWFSDDIQNLDFERDKTDGVICEQQWPVGVMLKLKVLTATSGTIM